LPDDALLDDRQSLMISDPWFYAAAIPALIVLGLSKGGFAGIGTLATPIVVLAVSPVQAASILLPILVVQSLYSIYVRRRHWDAFILRVLLPGACIGILVGNLLAARLPEAEVGLAVGQISIVFGLRQLMSRSAASGPSERPRVALGWFWGALSGFTSMISHAGGPPFQIDVMPQRLESRVFVATSVLFFAVVNWMKVHRTSRSASSLPPISRPRPRCFRWPWRRPGSACFWCSASRMSASASPSVC
jgi:uncharacterized membrane protein YfcA